ncbi:MAG TPA: hypothetical protein VFT53_01270 [Candidatus Saccharimonadales bacterium]|nr:hypothetical protein [Candidatus Saccharimonadales bacterium]
MDIRLIRKQLNTLSANLNNTDYMRATTDIKAFLAFLSREQLIKNLIDKLPVPTMEVEQWATELYGNAGSITLPEDEEERVAFCLKVLDVYKDNLDQVAFSFHIASNAGTDHVRYYLECIARPVYQYIDQKLHEQEIDSTSVSQTMITAEHVIFVGGNNYGTISQNNNDAMQLFNKLAEEIKKSELDTNTKLEAVANIDTMKSQVVLPKPNWHIVKMAWETVRVASHTAGVITLIEQINTLIQAHIK